MDHGRLVEQGTHQSLLNGGGYYTRLYNAQFRGIDRAAAGQDTRTQSPSAQVMPARDMQARDMPARGNGASGEPVL
jgi:hypothetical protein